MNAKFKKKKSLVFEFYFLLAEIIDFCIPCCPTN